MSGNNSYIYKITNTVTGKAYIGFTSRTLEQRSREHFNSARAGVKNYFYNSIRKHGADKFKGEILFSSPDSEYCLNEMEKKYIAEHGTFGPGGYNMTSGGEGTLGLVHTEETKSKMSKSKIGVPKSAETKANMRGPKSPEHRANMKLAWVKRRANKAKKQNTVSLTAFYA